MGLDNVTAMSTIRRVRWAWLAADMVLLGAYSCFLLERNKNYVGIEYVLIPWFLPWLSAWIYFVFWRRFGDVLAKTLALTIGGVWNYECYEGIWRFVEGGAWGQVIGFLTHEFVGGLVSSFAWSAISWLLGGLALWAVLRVKKWLVTRKSG